MDRKKTFKKHKFQNSKFLNFKQKNQRVPVSNPQKQTLNWHHVYYFIENHLVAKLNSQKLLDPSWKNFRLARGF